jgi:hypothetical protein
VTLNNLIITKGSYSGNGGCIYNTASLTIFQSTITGCSSTGNGSGIYNAGTLTVTGSTIYGNTGGTYGGGIFSDTGTTALTVSNSTITGNTASFGGGIATFVGALSLTHVTLTGNRGYGGGVAAFSSVAPTFVGSLIAGNSASGGSYADYYSSQNFYTIPAGNLINTGVATTTPTAYQPNLAPLGTYGGPTLTMPALPGPITGDTIAFCYAQTPSSSDQRGFSGTTYNGVTCNDAGATQSYYTLLYGTVPAASYTQGVAMGSSAPVVKFYDHGFAIPAAVGSVVFTDADSVITGTTTVALSAGSASPTAASFTTPETGDTLTGKYTLTLPTSATTVLATPASSTFNVLSVTPTQVVLSAITSPITAGSSIGSFTASIETAGGTVVTTSTATVSYVLTGPTGNTIASGSAAAVNGVASFSITTPLTLSGSYTLTASSGTLTNGVKTIVVNAGVATQLVYTSNAPSGLTNTAAYTIGPIGVTVEDVYGNTVTTPATTITYTLTGTTGFTTLTGTVTSVGGVGTVFPNGQGLSVPTTYTLTVSSGTLTPATVTFGVVQLAETVGLTITSPITYGTTLAGLTPTATYGGSPVAGSFTYTATLGTGSPVAVTTLSVLTPGTYVITATFLPANATTYKTGQTASAPLVVNKATPTVTLSASSSAIFINDPVTLTASVPAVGAGVFPTLTVTFKNGTTAVGSGNLTPLGSISNTASYVYTPTTSGAESLTAVYNGDSNYNMATSAPLSEGVVDFTITASPQIIQTTKGSTVTSVITLTPVGGTTFPGALTLTLNSTNISATASLSSYTVASGATTGAPTLSIVIPTSFAKMEQQHGIDPRVNGYAPVAFALLLLPFANRMRKSSKRLKAMLLMLVLGVCAMGTLSGCSGGVHGSHVTENIAPVVVTATNGSATHSVTVTAVVAE